MPISGVPFAITGKTLVGVDVRIETETDENGEINLENLLVGDYTVQELESDLTAGYILSDAETAFVVADALAEMAIENKLQRGDLRIIKTFEGSKRCFLMDNMNVNTVLCGDAIQMLQALPVQSVHTCVCSPPYYGLRDYGMPEQIGLEESPQAYVEKLTAVFREVRRVLRDDGTLWINIADSYAGSGTLPPPVPIRPVSVCIVPLSSSLTRLSAG